MYLEGN